MAIPIRRIPILGDKVALSFIQKAEDAAKKKGTIDFSKQIRSANNILAKAQLS